jgi:nitrite reductase/ring-hydroxylating ferredoxin subunit
MGQMGTNLITVYIIVQRRTKSMKKVLLDNEEYIEALDMLNKLMMNAEQITDVDHKVLLYNILQYFDYIHREPLNRIIKLLNKNEVLRSELLQDETVQKLCSLYDIPVEESPLDKNEVLAFIPEDQIKVLTPIKHKTWLEMGHFSEFEDRKLYAKNFEKVNFLISRLGSDVYAFSNQCDGSILPMDKGTLEDHYLICPWHGCKYDLKTGESLNKADKKLDVFQTEIDEKGLLKIEIEYC